MILGREVKKFQKENAVGEFPLPSPYSNRVEAGKVFGLSINMCIFEEEF